MHSFSERTDRQCAALTWDGLQVAGSVLADAPCRTPGRVGPPGAPARVGRHRGRCCRGCCRRRRAGGSGVPGLSGGRSTVSHVDRAQCVSRQRLLPLHRHPGAQPGPTRTTSDTVDVEPGRCHHPHQRNGIVGNGCRSCEVGRRRVDAAQWTDRTGDVFGHGGRGHVENPRWTFGRQDRHRGRGAGSGAAAGPTTVMPAPQA